MSLCSAYLGELRTGGAGQLVSRDGMVGGVVSGLYVSSYGVFGGVWGGWVFLHFSVIFCIFLVFFFKKRAFFGRFSVLNFWV